MADNLGEVFKDAIGAAILFIIIFVLAIAINYTMSGLGLTIFGHGPHYDVIEDNFSIVSISDVNSIDGSFFIGSGYINGQMNYILYAVDDDGGYVQISIPTDRSKIYDTELKDPHISVLHIWKISYDGELLEIQDWRRSDYPFYKIYVPPGTILKEFNLDGV